MLPRLRVAVVRAVVKRRGLAQDQAPAARALVVPDAVLAVADVVRLLEEPLLRLARVGVVRRARVAAAPAAGRAGEGLASATVFRGQALGFVDDLVTSRV